MKASETNILKFIGGLDKVFIIPPFQRNYEWTFEQCDELFEDIINSYNFKKSHYLGNIVYYEGKNNGASFSEFILVDGQQRVTTVLLLLCAIRDEMKRLNLPDENITFRYLENDNGGDLYRVRLKQTSYDADSFNMVVKGLVKENDKKNNIIRNYFHFISLLRESSSNRARYYAKQLIEMYDLAGWFQIAVGDNDWCCSRRRNCKIVQY